MKKFKEYKFHFLSLLLVCLIVFGLVMKYEIEASKNKFIIYVNQTTTTLPTTTTVKYKDRQINISCDADADCEWLSTNCCPETAGARWECINKNSDVSCVGAHALCIQEMRPKPNRPCVCLGGVCTG